MNKKCFLIPCLLFLGLYIVSAIAKDSDVSILEILQAVQKNVESLKEQNINLIADEEITIEEFDDKGKVKKTINILSEYRIIQTKSEKPFSYGIPQEERTVLFTKENGKVIKTKTFIEPYMFRFAYNGTSELFVLFDKQNEEYFDYELIGTDLSVLFDNQNEKYLRFKFNGIEEAKSGNVYIIDIVQKEADVLKSKNGAQMWAWNLKYKGVVQIDTTSMEIVRLNRAKSTTWRRILGFVSFARFCTINSARSSALACARACAWVADAKCKLAHSLPVWQIQTPHRCQLVSQRTE